MLREMKRIDETSETPKTENVFEMIAKGFGTEKVRSREEIEEDVVASLEEIEKLDAVLKIKLAEEKKAKLSRIQTEEESRDVLSHLPSSKIPDGVKVNVEQFLKLLSEAVGKEADPSPCFVTEDRSGGGEPEGKGGEKEGKASCLTFVERNIRLAKCGRGTLSLTDEEKSRIENLLVDVEDAQLKTVTKAIEFVEAEKAESKELYAFDQETKSILGEIDQRLEALAKLKTPKVQKGEADLLESGGSERISLDVGGKQSQNKGNIKERKKGNRLEEINKLLNSLNSASDEEIIPLPEEELGRLVEHSKQNLSEEKGSQWEDGGERPNPKLPQQVVAELVSGAKFLMPKFKYRFDEG